MKELSSKTDKFITMAMEYAPKLLLAIIVLVIGLWIIKKIVGMLGKVMDRSSLDQDVQPFLKSLIGVLLKVMLIFSVAGMVGIETTSFVAVLAAAGFAIGMALQGSLGNFASGVMILIFKPYKVGDLVQAQDQLGHIDEVQIFNTIMTTLDHKQVIVPNGQAISGTITNLSHHKFMRVDLNVLIPYEQDFEEAQKIAVEALRNVPKALNEPAPYVEIEEFGDHNIKLAARTHSSDADYWDVFFGANKALKQAFSKAGIQINYAEGVQKGNY
jgi:small conductance mechanosensitive channel